MPVKDDISGLNKMQKILCSSLEASEAEKKLLDRELDEYEREKDAGIAWREAIAQLRARG
jgi:hypothetical protein